MKGPIHKQFAKQRMLHENFDSVWAGWRLEMCVCGTKSDRFEIVYTNKRIAEQFVACNGIFV
jgi:hypothetical protein